VVFQVVDNAFALRKKSHLVAALLFHAKRSTDTRRQASASPSVPSVLSTLRRMLIAEHWRSLIGGSSRNKTLKSPRSAGSFGNNREVCSSRTDLYDSSMA
jgi:hypothetical protein